MNLISLPRRILNRLQPFTKRHPDSNPISDLFPWIVTPDLDTHFQTHDINSLFNPSSQNISSSALIVVFNSSGIEIIRKSIAVQSLIKNPISLSKLLRSSSFQFGTFSIFHHYNPASFCNTSMVLTERGYSYFSNYKNPFRHYVHGNSDAITLNNLGDTTCLGGISFLPRIFYCQHLFLPSFTYELFFVNSSSSFQSISIFESSDDSFSDSSCLTTIFLPSRGSSIFKYQPSDRPSFLFFRSKLVLCRPICFKQTDNFFDVFHC